MSTRMHPLLHKGSITARVPSYLWYLLGGAAGIATLVYVTLADNPIRNTFLALVRSPQSILDAVTNINPATNPDLQPGANGGTTWCNKFLYLVLRQLGIVIPWAQYGVRVNDMISWIGAGNDGWYQVPDANTAQNIVLNGGVAIVTYFNPIPGASGHAAIILPTTDADVQIAQAGAHNYNQCSIPTGFGSLPVVFFAHA